MTIPGLHLIGGYGEALMQRYLETHHIPFVREPDLEPVTTRRIDFAVTAFDGSRVLIEVKTIWQNPPLTPGGFFPFPPIRSHISAAARQFSSLPETTNVIALAAFPGAFVDLHTPRVMLSAMYGDIAFRFPVNTKTGVADSASGEWFFSPEKGAMVQKVGQAVRPRNSRIAALLSLHPGSLFQPELDARKSTPFAEIVRQAIEHAKDEFPVRDPPYVTVWENAGAKAKLPVDLFAGSMDMNWGVQGDVQLQTFIGEERAKCIEQK